MGQSPWCRDHTSVVLIILFTYFYSLCTPFHRVVHRSKGSQRVFLPVTLVVSALQFSVLWNNTITNIIRAGSARISGFGNSFKFKGVLKFNSLLDHLLLTLLLLAKYLELCPTAWDVGIIAIATPGLVPNFLCTNLTLTVLQASYIKDDKLHIYPRVDFYLIKVPNFLPLWENQNPIGNPVWVTTPTGA